MQKRLLFIFICFFQYDYTFAIRCNAGKYSSGSVCFNCLKGTYQPDAGATSCFQCNRGTYQSIDGSTSCLSCNAGSFQANVGQANCLACGIGTYQPDGQGTMCEKCPANQSTFLPSTYSYSISGGTTCSLCPKSFYLLNDACESCNQKPGFYCNGEGGPLECSTLKKPNEYYFKTCDTSSDAIISTCTICKEKNGYADKPCTNTSDAICIPCTQCNPMQEYAFNECTETRDTLCKPCDRQAGDIQIGGKCNPCPPGAFGPQCELCLPGTFSPIPNSIQCIPCPLGEVSGAGASRCVKNRTSACLGQCASPSGLLLAAYDLSNGAIQAIAPTMTPGKFMVVTASPTQLYVMSNGSSWLFAGAYASSSIIMDGKGVQAIFYPRVLQICLDVYTEGYLLLEETGALRWISPMAIVKTLSSSLNARSIAPFTGKGSYQFLIIRLEDNVLLNLNVLDETYIPLVGIVDYQFLFPLSVSVSSQNSQNTIYVLDKGVLLALNENLPSSTYCGGGRTLFTPSSNNLDCSTVSLGSSGAISHLEYNGDVYILFYVDSSWSGIAKIIKNDQNRRMLTMMLILTDKFDIDDVPLNLVAGPDALYIAYRNPAHIFKIAFPGQCQCLPGFYCTTTQNNVTLCLEPPLGQIAPTPWTSTPIPCPLGSISISTTQCAPCPNNFTTARKGAWFCRSVCENDQFMNPQTGECLSNCNASLGLYHERLLGQCLPCWLGSGSDGGQSCIACPPGQYGITPGICATCPIGTTTVMPGTTRCMPLSFAWCQDGGITCPPTTNQPWTILQDTNFPSKPSGLMVWPNGTHLISFYNDFETKIPLGYFTNPFPTIIWMDINKDSTLYFGETIVTWEPKTPIYGIAVMQVQGYVPMVYVSTMLSLEEGTPPCAEVYAISTFDRTVTRFMSQDLLKSPTILLSQCILQPMILHVTTTGILYTAVGSWLYSRLIIGPNASPQGLFNQQPLLQVDKGVITFLTSVGDGHLFVGTSTGQIHSVPPNAIQLHGYKTQLVDVKSVIRGLGAAGRRVYFTTDTELKEIIFDNVKGCMAGYIPTNLNSEWAGVCMQSGRGTYSGIACPKGTYGPEAASLYCLPCPAGTIAPSTNSPICTPCEDITSFSNAEGTACLTTCPSSQTSTQRSCMGCNPGYILENGICVACKPGTYSPSGSTTCMTCKLGETSPAGAQDCVRICSKDTECAYDGQNCISLTKHYEVLSQIKMADGNKQILGLAVDIEGGVFYSDGIQIQYYLDTCSSYNTKCSTLIMDLLPSGQYKDYKFTSLALCNQIQTLNSNQELSTSSSCNVFRTLYIGSLFRSSIYKLNICLDLERKVNAIATRLFSKLTLVSGNSRSGFADGPFSKAIFNQPVDLELNAACNCLYVSDFGNHRIRILNFTTQQVTTVLGSGQPCWKEGSGDICPSPSTMGCNINTDQCASLQYPLGIGLSEDENSLYIAGNQVNSLFVYRFKTKRLVNVCSFTFTNMDTGKIQTCRLNVKDSKGCMLYRPFDVAAFQGQLFVGVTQGITRIDEDNWSCEQVAGQFFDLQTYGLKDGIMPLPDVNTTLSTSLVNMPFKMAVSKGTGVMYFADLLNGAVRRVLVKSTCMCPVGTQLLPSAHSCYNPSPSTSNDLHLKPLLECPNGFYALPGDRICFRSCNEAFEQSSIPSQCLVLPTSPLQSVTYSQLLSRLSPPQNTMLADWYGQGTFDPGFLFPLSAPFRQGMANGQAPSSNGAFVSLTFDLKRKCWSDVESLSSYALRPQLILPGLWLAYGETMMAQSSIQQTCSFTNNFVGFERSPVTSDEEALATRNPKRWQALRNAAVAGGAPGITQSTAFMILGTPDQSAPNTCVGYGQGPCFPLFQDASIPLTNTFQKQWTKDNVLRIQCFIGWPAHYYCPNGYRWTPPDLKRHNCSDMPRVATCLSCLPGTFSFSTLQNRQILGGPYTCTACAVGYYSSGVGSTECLACPSNTYSSALGSSQCTSCAPGTYTNLRAARSPLQCLNCVRGTGNCTDCVPGEYQHLTGQVRCEVVPAGYFSTSVKAEAPIPCELGTYQPNQGSSSCLTCNQGFVTDSIGATTCTQCPNTPFCSLSIGNKCGTGCGLNAYYDLLSQSCKFCPKGTLNAENPCATNPNVCWENPRKDLYIHPLTKEILQCPGGTEASFDKSNCVNCFSGYYSDSLSGGCQLCRSGTYTTMEKSTGCLFCPPGYSNSIGDQGCSVCKPGTFAYTNGSSICSPCPTGFIAPDFGSTSCKACPLDTVAPAKGMFECNVTCNTSEGFYSVAGDSACRYCSDGLAIEASCRTCGKGYYLLILNNNIRTCQICNPGLVNLFNENATNSSDCQPCPSPTAYALSNAMQCIEADEGFIPNSTLTGQKPCLIGTYRNSSQTECNICDPGSFASNSGSRMCTLCPMGFYTPDSGRSECIQCQSGRISGFMGASVCTPCPAGTFTTNNKVCLPCPNNTFSNGGSTSCTSCARGLHSQGGASICLSCPPWTIWSDSQKACIVCSPGTFMVRSGSTFYCQACEAGKFLPFSGAITIRNCTSCVFGTVAIRGGASTCTNCSTPGTTAQNDGINCAPCEPGTYNTDGGVCQPCPRGTFSSSNKASNCQVCAPGTFQNVSMGGTSCTLCPPGTISFGSQDHDCISCIRWGTNVFNPNPGQTICQPKKQTCNPFQYVNLSHDPTKDNTCVDCVPCAPGEWASAFITIQNGFDVLRPNTTGNFLSQLCPGTTSTPLYRCLSTAPKAGEYLAFTESVGSATMASSPSSSSTSMLDPFVFTKCSDSNFNNLTVEWVVGFDIQACYISCKYGVNSQAISMIYPSIKLLLLYVEAPTQNIFLQPWLQYKDRICLSCPNNPCPLGLYRPDFGYGCGPPCGLSTNLCQLDNTGCIAQCTNKPANSGYIGGSSILGKDWCPWQCSLGYFLSDNRTTCLPCGSQLPLQLCNSSDYALVSTDQCLPWYTSRELCRYCTPLPFAKLVGWNHTTGACQYQCFPGYYANITNNTHMICTPCNQVQLNNWTLCPIGTYLDDKQCYDKGIRPSCQNCIIKEDASFVSAGILNEAGSCKASCSPGFHSVSNKTNMYADYADLNSFPTVNDLKCIPCSPQDTRSCNFTTACFSGFFRNMSVRDGQPNSCVQCKQSRHCPIGTYALPCTGANLTDAQCLPCPSSLLVNQQFVNYGLNHGRIISPNHCPRTCLNNHVQNQNNILICEPCPTTTPCLLTGTQPPLCSFVYAYWNATPDTIWWDQAYTPPFILYSTGIVQRAGICWACPIGTATFSNSNALCVPLPGYASAKMPIPNGKLPIPTLPTDVYLTMQIPRFPTLQSRNNRGRRLYQFQIMSQNITTTTTTTSNALAVRGAAVPCPYGTYKSDAGDGFCNTCPEGSSTMSTKSIALSSCMCRYGYYLVAKQNGPCLPCPIDTFLNVTVSILTTTPPKCIPCPPNTSTLRALGATTCACALGYVRIKGSCVLCKAGFYCPPCTDRDVKCIPSDQRPCFSGATSLPGSYDITNCTCNSPGLVISKRPKDTTQLYCRTLPLGSTLTVDGQIKCLPGWTSSSTNPETCTLCPPGTYATVASNGKSLLLRSVTNTPICIPCPANTYNPTTSAIGECTMCPAQQISSKGSISLSNCSCPSSQISVPGGCKGCLPNQYTTVNGCNDCPLNSLAQAGASSLKDCLCKPGYALTLLSSTAICEPCKKGFYSTHASNTPCMPCPKGSTTAGIGSTRLTSCGETSALCLPGYTWRMGVGCFLMR